MFGRNLQDMVKGIRKHQEDSGAFISKCIADIRTELKSRDVSKKVQALEKLVFVRQTPSKRLTLFQLQMLGYDIGWAAFAAVEVMASPKFSDKRVAYLVAAQCFTPKTDVALLCTNSLSKEFQSKGTKNAHNTGLAINCLSNICTADLARDLLNDVVVMLSSSNESIRKKATLVLYRIFLKYPQGLRLAFEALKKRLLDPDTSVCCSAVNVICELARKRPENYLGLAPVLYKLMIESKNNWTTIKIVKLFAILVAKEPRLARKLLQPLCTIIQDTGAKSLQYECLYTITVCLQHTKRADGSDAKNVPAVLRLCSTKFREMVDDTDPNLKYLGLVGLGNLMRSHPRAVVEHRELILGCLSNHDPTIRMGALDLVTGMVTKRSLKDFVKTLLSHIESADGRYRERLIEKILFICSRDTFAFLSDFAWYISVLVDLAPMRSGKEDAAKIAAQLLEVTMRVPEVRTFAVESMVMLVTDTRLLAGSTGESVADLLFAASWIIGEYIGALESSRHSEVVGALLQPAVGTNVPRVQAAVIQAILKVLSSALKCSAAGDESIDIPELIATIEQAIKPFVASPNVNVQHRACVAVKLLEIIGGDKSNSSVLASLFVKPLPPVRADAQRRVPVPEGLDLSAAILEVGKGAEEDEEEEEEGSEFIGGGFISVGGSGDAGDDSLLRELEDAERAKDEKSRESRGASTTSRSARRRKDDPFYLPSSVPEERPEERVEEALELDLSSEDAELRDIPIRSLKEAVGSVGKGKGGSRAPSLPTGKKYKVTVTEELPEGALPSDEEATAVVGGRDSPDSMRIEDIDVTKPLGCDEVFVQPQHRQVKAKKTEPRDKSLRKKKKRRRKKDEAEDGVGDLLGLVPAEGEKKKKRKKKKKKKKRREEEEE